MVMGEKIKEKIFWCGFLKKKKEGNIPDSFDFVPLSQQTLMAAYSIPGSLLGVKDINMNYT